MTETEEPRKLTDAEAAARKRRSRWTAVALFAFVILIFAITISRLGTESLVGGQ